MPTVHGVNLSPFVRKVRVFLAEKGVEYDLNPVNPFEAGPEYRKISPLGKIPAFEDGDVTLADSSVICSYVEHAHPTPALYPSDIKDNARALWFEEYGDSGVSPTLGTVFFQKIVAPDSNHTPRHCEAVSRGRTAGQSVAGISRVDTGGLSPIREHHLRLPVSN